MPQSLAKNIIHLIYSTKNREPSLSAKIRPEIFAYQAAIFRKCDSPAAVIGGEADHVHALFLLSRKSALSGVVEEVKRGSSKWIKTQGSDFADFYWQSGYGAFSVSPSQVEQARRYIEGQSEHHRTVSYQDEFRAFLREYGIEYDEQYVWD